MTNDDVVALISARVPDDAILLAIKGGEVRFDFSESAVQELKQRGISEVVLTAMRRMALQGAGPAGRFAERSGVGGATLTNDSVVEMLRAGLSEDVVVLAIQTSHNAKFDTAPSSLIDLHRRGVPPSVLKAMLATENRPDTPESGAAGPTSTGASSPASRYDPRLADTLRALERELGDLRDQRTKTASELSTTETNGALSASLCNNSTVVGSLNCFTADLNNRATASKQQRLAVLDSKIQDIQSQLAALRAAAAESGVNLQVLLDAVGARPAANTVVWSPRVEPDVSVHNHSSEPGRLFVYRVYKFNQSMGNPTVSCDGIDLAVLKKGAYFLASLSAGDYTCSMKGMAASDATTSVHIESGQQYFMAYRGGARDHSAVLTPVKYSRSGR